MIRQERWLYDKNFSVGGDRGDPHIREAPETGAIEIAAERDGCRSLSAEEEAELLMRLLDRDRLRRGR